MIQTARIELGGVAPSCFASISWTLQHHHHANSSTTNLNVLKLETSSGKLNYVSVISQGQSQPGSGSGYGGGGEDKDNYLPVIKLHSKFATALGLGDGDVVTVVQETGSITPVPRADVVCVSQDDWEILESNATSVSSGLLHQLRVVYPGLKFPFWISKSLSINLMIEKITPEGVGLEYGILTDNSEIVIPSSAPIKDDVRNITAKFRIHPTTVPDSVLCQEAETEATLFLLVRNTRHVFLFFEDAGVDARNRSTESRARADVDESWAINQSGGGANDEGFSAVIQPLDSEVQIAVKAIFIEKCQFPARISQYFPITNPPSLYIHPELIKEFGLEEKTYLSLSSNDNDVEQETGTVIGVDKQCKIIPVRQDEKKDFVEKIAFSGVLEKSREFIEAALSLGVLKHEITGPQNGSLLIEGREGCGKTWFCQNLAEGLEGPPYNINCEILSCAKFRGKKPETMEKELQPVLERSQRFQPSVIFLDDLDVITPTGQALQENLQEQFLHFKTCETIMDALCSLRGEKVVIVATAKTKESLNSYWKSRQGFHFFHEVASIPMPNAEERLNIFKESLHQLNLNPNMVSKMKHDELEPELRNLLKSIHDQQATPRLIRNIAQKLSSISVSNDDDDETDCANTLSNSNILKELKEFVKQEITFSEGSRENKSDREKQKPLDFWKDIRGLRDIKDQLVKILNWPIKYHKLLKNAPIKLPSGILLYGYPGTGKTLLGLSIPSLVNAKFIHIKGPELLSKYIGASEQAVQDVFKRARSWSPCVIFFDEFDSLVPRRGHDSTGVTDRVVNQFLAEMDGIEGGLGEGVYLVAATSRPDLIDPAVLRPGRLDKHLFFDFPSKEDREDILRILGEKVNLQLHLQTDSGSASDSNAKFLDPDSLKGLTGADIHSLICSAQLIAVQRFLRQIETCEDKDPSFKKGEVTAADIPVSMEDLQEALSSFRPSIQGAELTKFSKIYETFSSGKAANQEMKPRATLA